jgi:hypothetical protein
MRYHHGHSISMCAALHASVQAQLDDRAFDDCCKLVSLGFGVAAGMLATAASGSSPGWRASRSRSSRPLWPRHSSSWQTAPCRPLLVSAGQLQLCACGVHCALVETHARAWVYACLLQRSSPWGAAASCACVTDCASFKVHATGPMTV